MLIDKINKNIILVNIVLEFQLADVQKTLSLKLIFNKFISQFLTKQFYSQTLQMCDCFRYKNKFVKIEIIHI